MNELDLENIAIKWLESQGYQHKPGASLERQTREPLLLSDLDTALAKLNPHLPVGARQDAIKILKDRFSPHADLLDINEEMHHFLVRGVPVEYQHGGHTRGDQIS